MDSRFIGLGTSWSSVASFTPLPLYPWRQSRLYPLDKRLSGPQSRSGLCGEVKTFDPTGTRIPTPLSSNP
jgi:hypothetical protein